MDNCNITVALLFGGEGCEREVSVMGADHAMTALTSKGFFVLPVLIKRGGGWFARMNKNASAADMDLGRCALAPTFPIRLGNRRGFVLGDELLPVDAVIPLLHGEGGEDGTVQGALRCAGIPYIGCDTVCSAVCLDKAFLKLVARDIGIPTVKGIYTTEYSEQAETVRRAEELIGYPMFVKPTRLGSSVGASAARNEEELVTALDAAQFYSKRILIEKLIVGARELECAVIRTNSKLLFTNIGEILYHEGFYDYDSKYSSGSSVKISTDAKLDAKTKSRIKQYARLISEAVGISGLSRIDFFLDGNGNVYLNEINTFPGMTTVSMFPRLISEAGMPLADLFEALIHEALL